MQCPAGSTLPSSTASKEPPLQENFVRQTRPAFRVRAATSPEGQRRPRQGQTEAAARLPLICSSTIFGTVACAAPCGIARALRSSRLRCLGYADGSRCCNGGRRRRRNGCWCGCCGRSSQVTFYAHGHDSCYGKLCVACGRDAQPSGGFLPQWASRQSIRSPSWTE